MLALKKKDIFASQAKSNQATSTGGREPQLLANSPKAAIDTRDAAAAALAATNQRIYELLEYINNLAADLKSTTVDNKIYRHRKGLRRLIQFRRRCTAHH